MPGAIAATKPLSTQQDLALAYSPGVAAACDAIAAAPGAARSRAGPGRGPGAQGPGGCPAALLCTAGTCRCKPQEPRFHRLHIAVLQYGSSSDRRLLAATLVEVFAPLFALHWSSY